MSRPKPWEVSDELWELIEPLIPQPHRPYGHPGRKRIDDRKTLQGILFVLYTQIQWDFLPQEMGFGSEVTYRRRLRTWATTTPGISSIRGNSPGVGRP